MNRGVIMGLLDLFKTKATVADEEPQERKLVKEDFKVVGVHYHPNEIKRLQNANPDWRKGGKTLAAEGKCNQKIYHYSYINKPVKIAFDDGKVYIDRSCRVATKKQAMKIGRELNQLSVLRWRDGECLTVE